MFSQEILFLCLTVEAKMALKSSFHIKYWSRNPKHFSKLLLKNTLDGVFHIACPYYKLGIHLLYENGMKWFKLHDRHLLCSKCFCKIWTQKVSIVEQSLWCLERLPKNSNQALLKSNTLKHKCSNMFLSF